MACTGTPGSPRPRCSSPAAASSPAPSTENPSRPAPLQNAASEAFRRRQLHPHHLILRPTLPRQAQVLQQRQLLRDLHAQPAGGPRLGIWAEHFPQDAKAQPPDVPAAAKATSRKSCAWSAPAHPCGIHTWPSQLSQPLRACKGLRLAQQGAHTPVAHHQAPQLKEMPEQSVQHFLVLAGCTALDLQVAGCWKETSAGGSSGRQGSEVGEPTASLKKPLWLHLCERDYCLHYSAVGDMAHRCCTASSRPQTPMVAVLRPVSHCRAGVVLLLGKQPAGTSSRSDQMGSCSSSSSKNCSPSSRHVSCRPTTAAPSGCPMDLKLIVVWLASSGRQVGQGVELLHGRGEAQHIEVLVRNAPARSRCCRLRIVKETAGLTAPLPERGLWQSLIVSARR
jgi:hypothetical protein